MSVATNQLEIKLTFQQRELLITLVHYDQQGKLNDPIILIPAGASEYVIFLQGEPSLRIERVSDLDRLCAANLMTYRLNRMGNGKVYRLTKASHRAAEMFSELPADLPPMNWAALVSETENRASLKARLRLFKSLRAKLRHEMVYFLPDPALVEMVAELTAVGRQLESDQPDPDQVTRSIRLLGHRLVEHFSAEQAAVCSQALTLFGSWCRVTYQILNQLKKYRRW